jgi:hypothetical protein
MVDPIGRQAVLGLSKNIFTAAAVWVIPNGLACFTNNKRKVR